MVQFLTFELSYVECAADSIYMYTCVYANKVSWGILMADL